MASGQKRLAAVLEFEILDDGHSFIFSLQAAKEPPAEPEVN
jgi:hypothetical protein